MSLDVYASFLQLSIYKLPIFHLIVVRTIRGIVGDGYTEVIDRIILVLIGGSSSGRDLIC